MAVRRALRWMVRLALVAVALVAIACSIAIALVHTDWGREQIRSRLEAQLQETFVGGAHVGAIEGSPFGTLVGKNVVLNAPDGTPAIAVERVEAELALAPLLHHVLRAEHVRIDGATVIVAQRHDMGSLLQKGEPSPWRIELPDVALRRGAFVMHGVAIERASVLGHATFGARRGRIEAAAIATGVWPGHVDGFFIAASVDARGPHGTVIPGALVATAGGSAASVYGLAIEPDSDAAPLYGIGSVRLHGRELAPFVESVRGELAGGFAVWPGAHRAELFATTSATTPEASVDGAIVRASIDVRARTADVFAVGDVAHEALHGHAAVAYSGSLAGGHVVVVASDRDRQAFVAGTIDRARRAVTDGVVIATADDTHGKLALGATFHGTRDAYAIAGAIDARDASVASFAAASLHAQLAVEHAHGTYTTTGTIAGHALRAGKFAARDLHANLALYGLPTAPAGTATLAIADARHGDTPLGAISATAHSLADNRLAVAIRSTPPAAPVGRANRFERPTATRPANLDPAIAIPAISLDAIIAHDSITLGHHAIRIGPDEWSGTGGTIAFDPARITIRSLATTSSRGQFALAAIFDRHTRALTATLAAHVVPIGPLASPLDVRADLSTTSHALEVRVAASGPAMPHVVEGTLALDTTIDALPRTLLSAPLHGKLALATTSAPRALALLGRTKLVGGSLTGSLTIAGTLADPALTGELVGDRLAVHEHAELARLVASVRLRPRAPNAPANVDLSATAADGGALALRANGDPAHPDATTVSLVATHFDLAPLLALAPGRVGGVAGRLDADLHLTGLDERARLTGKLHVVNTRIPISPTIGTLREADLDVAITNTHLAITAHGKLGPGTVKIDSDAALLANAPIKAHANIELRNVRPIGALQPKIDADLTADLHPALDRWVIALVVTKGKIVVPEDRGEPLAPIGAPSDVRTADNTGTPPPPPPTPSKPGDPAHRSSPPRQPPAAATPRSRFIPRYAITIELKPTFVQSAELRGYIQGKLTLQPDARGLNLVGTIEAQRGDLDLFGRRYSVERAAAHFDGTTDPLVDVRVVHDFPEVTTITEVHGRLSNPQLRMSTDPAIYTDGQMLGFLLGGEPGGDPANGNARTVATSAGTSVVANQLGKYLEKALPFHLDVLRYDGATASNSDAVTVGSWVTRSLFVAYRRHLDARPDENAGEGELEYWLAPALVVEGAAGDRGYDGVDLVWRHRY